MEIDFVLQCSYTKYLNMHQYAKIFIIQKGFLMVKKRLHPYFSSLLYITFHERHPYMLTDITDRINILTITYFRTRDPESHGWLQNLYTTQALHPKHTGIPSYRFYASISQVKIYSYYTASDLRYLLGGLYIGQGSYLQRCHVLVAYVFSQVVENSKIYSSYKTSQLSFTTKCPNVHFPSSEQAP